MTLKLSVVINAQDVEKDLPRCLNSVKDLANEIVVIDHDSIDGTKKIAQEFGAKIYRYKRVNHVELARNFAIQKAFCDWVLILDADEEIPPALAKKTKEIVNDGRADYYRIPRKNIVFGKWLKHSRWWPDYNIRLFKKGCVSWNEMIHGVPVTQGKGVDFENDENLAIIHHHYESIEQYIERMNRYTSIQAGDLVNGKYKFDWKDLISKPAGEFLSRYFFGQGYKDGLHGLAVSLLQSCSELVVYLKVWQTEKFSKKDIDTSEVIDQMRKYEKDFHYWQNDIIYRGTGSIVARIKRRLRL